MAAACCSFLKFPILSSISGSRAIPPSYATIRPPISPKHQPQLLNLSKHSLCNNNGDSFFDPSLRFANVLFFKSAYNVQIVVDDDEPEEVLMRRFKREVSKAGVIQEVKRRRYFENKQEEKKRKAREAGRRNRRRRQMPRFPSSRTYEDTTPKKASEDDDDNWDLPEGVLP